MKGIVIEVAVPVQPAQAAVAHLGLNRGEVARFQVECRVEDGLAVIADCRQAPRYPGIHPGGSIIMKATTLLKKDHTAVKKLLRAWDKAEKSNANAQKKAIFDEMFMELDAHMKVEVENFSPALWGRKFNPPSPLANSSRSPPDTS